ncbi:MAG: hypothetical protein N3F66_05805 [Spirochaetes bacterium]|nr:hypothetical protein [Spirochaetota bacterium]
MKILSIIPAIIIITFLPAFGYALIFADTYYTNTCAGKEGYVQGLGIGVSCDIPFKLSGLQAMWYCSSSISYGQKYADKPWNTSIFLFPVTGGMYLDYTFATCPIKMNAGIGGGAVYIRKYTPKHYGPYMDVSQTEVHDSLGPRIEAIIGLGYIITQKISFFIRAGYQFAWCDEEYIEKNIHGSLIYCGLQWTLQGINKGLFDE